MAGLLTPNVGGETAVAQALTPSITPIASSALSDTASGTRTPQENSILSPIISLIKGHWTRTELARRSFESRWLDAYRNYRGLYGPDTAFSETERSRVFVKVTKTKVFSAYGQLIDIFFANNSFPITVSPERLPGGVSSNYNVETNPQVEQSEQQTSDESSQYGYPGDGTDLEPGFVAKLQTKVQKFLGQLRQNETLNPGAATSPSAVDVNPSEIGAKQIEKQIMDQLGFSEADKHLRKAAFENCLLGTCVIKGPLAATQEVPYWDENGAYLPEKRIYPKMNYVSLWDFYPDPDCTNISNCQWVIERHRLTRSQMHELKSRPFFRPNEIDNCLAEGYNYLRLWWEQAIRDIPAVASVERFEVLEYWGMVDKDTAKEHGLSQVELDRDFKDVNEVPVNVWICGNHVLRFVLNPFNPNRLPYYIIPHEMQPYSPWGIGVAENMSDTQVLMNGFMRMSVDNAALSGNCIFEIDESLLVPGQDYTLYPGKMFRKNAGANQMAVQAYNIPNISQQNMQMFDKARELADEATFPSVLSGNTSVNPSLGRTSSGMSMMMGSASVVIRNVVKNFDDYLFAPLGQAMYAFNRQFNPSKDAMINVVVKASGTDSLMRNEILSQRLASVAQMGAQPMLAPFIKWPQLLREQFKSMELDPDTLTNTSEEALRQAHYMQSLMQAQGTPNPGQQGTPQGHGQPDQQAANVAHPGNKGFSANHQQPQPQPQGQPSAPATNG